MERNKLLLEEEAVDKGWTTSMPPGKAEHHTHDCRDRGSHLGLSGED